jgi:1-acyl-sn-glycerol-3-phosphate acyltransferase
MKHIPADRFGRTELAIERSVAAVEQGEIVGMFPEGTISRSFVPRLGKTGAARIAMKAGAPLIPGVVWGSQRILTKGRPKNFERGVDISVDFGDPIPYGDGDDPQSVTDALMASIGELVKVAERRYPVRPGPADDWWLPAHLGGSAPTVEEADALAAREREERRARRAAAES